MRKVILMFTIALVAIVILERFSNRKAIANDLFLNNVEALAADESDKGYDCYGTGNVTCPANGEKVYCYMIPFNLE